MEHAPGHTLREAGEFGLIAAIAAVLRDGTGPRPMIGIGDDAAAWLQPAAALVASCDMLVEGVHFDLRLTGWRDLGWKALAVNLSDLAAMGAQPQWAFISAGLRADTRVADVRDFYAGLRELADRSGCTVAGGDTVSVHGAQVVDITVIGAVPADEASTLLRRSAGQAGDRVAVTGYLGASAAGLYALQHPGSAPEEAVAALVAAHRRPQPRLAAGRLLRRAGVRCAMDVSDGLLADLEKLCAASGMGAVVDQARLPVHPAAAGAYGARALEWAAGGGEDYELLFTAPPAVMAAALAALAAAGLRPAEVGRLVDQPPGVRLVDANGREVPARWRGWDHFAPPESTAP